MPFIYHLVPRADWEAAADSGQYAAPSLESEGFNHCSKDRDQLFAVANRLFAGRTDMLVLEIDTDRLDSPIKEEPARSGEVYPHIYGQINKSCVKAVFALSQTGDGEFTLTLA